MSDEIKCDRFGLPVHWTVLDGAKDLNEREAAVAVLVRDVVASVAHQVGRKEAMRLFATEFERLIQPLPPQGKKEDRLRNVELLHKYDALIAAGVPAKFAAGRLAKAECAVRPRMQESSLARHIREIAKARARMLAEYDEARRKTREKARRTLLGGNSDL